MDYKKVVEKWLTGEFDTATKQEILDLQNTDEKALEDAFYKNLEFGTGGLRGLMGAGTNRMNRYTVGMATQGLANYILRESNVDKASVCISYDSRNNSKLFANITAEVFASNGIKVYIFDDIRPTPELSYAIRLKKAVAGVMITASHNPKEYSGYKVFWSDGAQITSPVDKAVVDEVAKISEPSQVKFNSDEASAQIISMGADVDQMYLTDILSLTLSPESREKHSDIKFVYTPLHGCGVRLVPESLRRIGFKNIFNVPEQDISDGNFPTVVSPNPEEAASMKMALEVAEKNRADIVMATDPDADRIGIAVRDENGNMLRLNGNQTASMLTYYILRRWKELGKLDSTKYIVKTIVTTDLMRKIAEDFGLKCYNVLTGFKYIAEIVKANEDSGEFVCGGEESFGFNAGQFVRDKDAQLTAALIADCAAWAADQGMSLYQLLQDIYARYGYHKEALTSLTKKGKSGLEEIANIMNNLRSNPPSAMADSKIIKVIDYLDTESTGLPKSNVLQLFNEAGDIVSIRPSGTEPKIKFYFAAKGDNADEKLLMLQKEFVK